MRSCLGALEKERSKISIQALGNRLGRITKRLPGVAEASLEATLSLADVSIGVHGLLARGEGTRK